jgi:LPPG:FO 2-phospho-L-lactate transferase
MITALGGGVGAAKFLRGLSKVIKGEALTVIVNTGDDISISGLRISPDVDIVTYWLSNIVDRKKGWGVRGDTFGCLQALTKFGLEDWFKLGDRDIATHIFRTYLRGKGFKPSEIAFRIAKALDVGNINILPMTDEDVETWILTNEGEMHFQEYLVKKQMKPMVKSVFIRGIESRLIIICPSNPIISIGPILKIIKIREALQRTKARIIAISPLVGGKPLKGPADRLMKGVGLEVSSTQVAKLYEDFIDGIVIDEKDSLEANAIRQLGIEPFVLDTIMSEDEKAEQVAEQVLKLSA